MKNVIRTLKNKNSNVSDIAAPVITRKSDLFSLPLTILFNQSVASGTFPTKLKNAKVTPIHKAGLNTDPQSYRPNLNSRSSPKSLSQ